MPLLGLITTCTATAEAMAVAVTALTAAEVERRSDGDVGEYGGRENAT